MQNQCGKGIASEIAARIYTHRPAYRNRIGTASGSERDLAGEAIEEASLATARGTDPKIFFNDRRRHCFRARVKVIFGHTKFAELVFRAIKSQTRFRG